MSELIFHINQSPFSIPRLFCFCFCRKARGGAPLPADPPRGVIGSPEGWTGIPPVLYISGSFVCAAIAFLCMLQ